MRACVCGCVCVCVSGVRVKRLVIHTNLNDLIEKRQVGSIYFTSYFIEYNELLPITVYRQQLRRHSSCISSVDRITLKDVTH